MKQCLILRFSWIISKHVEKYQIRTSMMTWIIPSLLLWYKDEFDFYYIIIRGSMLSIGMLNNISGSILIQPPSSFQFLSHLISLEKLKWINYSSIIMIQSCRHRNPKSSQKIENWRIGIHHYQITCEKSPEDMGCLKSTLFKTTTFRIRRQTSIFLMTTSWMHR